MCFYYHSEVGVVVLRHVLLVLAQLDGHDAAQMWTRIVPEINSINGHQTYSELFFNSNKFKKKCTAYTALYRVHSILYILYISYAVKNLLYRKQGRK